MVNNILELDQGDVARVTATFTDPDTDAHVDPDAVNFRVKAPDGTVTTFIYGVDAEIARESDGVYRLHVSVDQNGRYYIYCFSTGQGQAAEQAAIMALNDRTMR